MIEDRSELLSITQAAKILRQPRTRLVAAIELHQVETVSWADRTWVPAFEVRRLLGVFAGDPHAFDHLTMEDLLTRACA